MLSEINGKINIFWFRRDLRFEDNTGLYFALSSQKKVLPIFIFDTNFVDNPYTSSDKRILFITACLKHLNDAFLNYGSSILILHGKPVDVFEQLITKYNIDKVFCNHDYEPYAIERDEKIKNLLNNKGIEFISYKDQVIFEKNEILKADATPYSVFTPYSLQWKKRFYNTELSVYPSESLLQNLVKINHKINFFVNFSNLQQHNINVVPHIPIDIIKNYHNTRNIPSVEGTSQLSHHLRFGTISIRKLAIIAKELNETWLNELIWREFFMMILFHFPHVVTKSFKSRYDNIAWRNNENEFKRWCEGETGYPIVDAGMRQLNTTGWMHNRVRMITASFLVKHLLIDWRWGEAYFAEKLLDYELSSNNGNWQWAAGSGCDASPYFRVFNPTEQTKKFDPQYDYIKKWIPEFGSHKYIEPIVEHAFARQRAIATFRRTLI